MTPVDILLELQELEVRVWVEDGALQFSSPLESLPDEVRAAISEHETGLMAFVAQMSKSADAPKAKKIEPAPRDQPLPLSFAQERFWFLSQLEEDSSAYNIVFPMRLRGPLDGDALERSLAEIIERHETLRTTVTTVDDRAVQEITPYTRFELPRVDLSAHDDPQADRGIHSRRVRPHHGRELQGDLLHEPDGGEIDD